MKKVILLFLVLSICSCGPAFHQRKCTFSEDEYAAYKGAGTSIIQGQAFLRTRGGDVKYAAGRTISLNPVTSYSTEWFELGIMQGNILSAPDPRITPFNRTTIADGMGNFEFRDLPAGEYYIATSIFWEVPDRWGMQRTGTNVGSKKSVGPGQIIKVILTR